ncbi:hypothetical protein [Helicobacter salomonis]|uniref:hypothetical protein n=1 Tax=Helicobacter salomonis TaxID=56878 RepID=UPI001315679F|nr:hypothetical protein [Helicobacter salomonis]
MLNNPRLFVNLLIVLLLTLTGANLYVSWVLEKHSKAIVKVIQEIHTMESSLKMENGKS